MLLYVGCTLPTAFIYCTTLLINPPCCACVYQINVGKLDPVSGTFTGESDVYALAGYLRGRVRMHMQ